MVVPDISQLYRLPYSKNDNPNGWIEITTKCNMKCPDCYRGSNRPDNINVHSPLRDIKQDIIQMEKIRNCRIISISGGEPLLHPDLEEIISFIAKRGMLPFLHTNGLLLTEDLVKRLKANGLIGIIIRVDSLMTEKKEYEEKKLNERRQKYAEMISAVKNINLGFITVVSKENLDEITDVIKWMQQNASMVDFLTLIPLRRLVFDKATPIRKDDWVTLEDLCENIQKCLPGIKYASFLGSQLENATIKWLQSCWIAKGNKFIDYIDKKFIEAIQMLYHFKNGKYSYIYRNGRNYINIFELFISCLFIKSIRKSFYKLFIKLLITPSLLFRKTVIQVMSITIPPGIIDGKRDLCDACPDAILYKGKLVPSCGLEEIKRFGKALEYDDFKKHSLLV